MRKRKNRPNLTFFWLTAVCVTRICDATNGYTDMQIVIEYDAYDYAEEKRGKFHYIENERQQPEWQRRRNQSRRAKSRMQEDF